MRALAVVAGLAALAVLASPAQTGTGPGVIRLTAVETSARFVGATGVAGSRLVVKQALYNPRYKGSLGTSSEVCTTIDRVTRWCVATWTLPRGKIVTGGTVASRLAFNVPILGGNGAYDDARGSLTVKLTKLNPRRERLTFVLVG